MKKYSDFLIEIKAKILMLERKGNHSYYAFSQDISASTANKIKEHFTLSGYYIEVKECPRKLFDIIIQW
jgi:hypothetical protein